jgi:hypothetical protein
MSNTFKIVKVPSERTEIEIDYPLYLKEKHNGEVTKLTGTHEIIVWRAAMSENCSITHFDMRFVIIKFETNPNAFEIIEPEVFEAILKETTEKLLAL